MTQYNVWDWIITKEGNYLRQIKYDDDPNLPHENILRKATKEDFIERGQTIPDNFLEWRMYFFVPHLYLSDKQIGIQSGHCALRYALRFKDNPLLWDFVKNHETFIILGAYDTNNDRDFNAVPAGSLNKIADKLGEAHIDFEYFEEPGMNNALTAVCFLVDERVFDWKTYPYYHGKYGWRAKQLENIDPDYYEMYGDKSPEDVYPEEAELCEEYVQLVGGVKNVILKELIHGAQLA